MIADSTGQRQCISCDVKGPEFFQAAEGATACDKCPTNSQRSVGSDGSSQLQCLCKEGSWCAAWLGSACPHQPQMSKDRTLHNVHRSPTMKPGAPCEACPTGARCSGDVNSPVPQPGFFAESTLAPNSSRKKARVSSLICTNPISNNMFTRSSQPLHYNCTAGA